jgi:uncharacterized protein YndB with AHSA1/START domain
MTRSAPPTPDPRLDLVLQREIDAPRERVWAAWTQPEHLRKWFVPAPWTVPECEVDLRPGGIFRFVLRSPEGEEHPNVACYLEVAPQERLVWTLALLPGYRPVRPSPVEPLVFTAIITLEARGKGTRYTATVLHRDEAEVKRHEEMGFHDGWGAVADQLAVLVKTL